MSRRATTWISALLYRSFPGHFQWWPSWCGRHCASKNKKNKTKTENLIHFNYRVSSRLTLYVKISRYINTIDLTWQTKHKCTHTGSHKKMHVGTWGLMMIKYYDLKFLLGLQSQSGLWPSNKIMKQRERETKAWVIMFNNCDLNTDPNICNYGFCHNRAALQCAALHSCTTETVTEFFISHLV